MSSHETNWDNFNRTMQTAISQLDLLITRLKILAIRETNLEKRDYYYCEIINAMETQCRILKDYKKLLQEQLQLFRNLSNNE
jgi:hypothetical protein